MNSRTKNFIYNVITFAVTIGLVVLAAMLAVKTTDYDNPDRFIVVLFFICGAIASAILHVVVHELGHVIAGKRNGFVLLSVRFFCFEFKKVNGKTKFCFSLNLSTAGETVMVPKGTENMKKRYARLAGGGIIASTVLALIGVAGMAVVSYLPLVGFAFTSMVLPITAYNLLSNALPMSEGGVMNDGAVVDGARRNTDSVIVSAKMLQLEAELYSGKSYKDVDPDLLFDLPQLPEDDFTFVVLLTNRYSYYLDKEDYENALKVSGRIYSLLDKLSKPAQRELKKNLLYDACAVKLNEEEADDLTAELEKTLNKDDSATGLRIKASYLLYVLKDYDTAEKFIKRGLKLADKEQIKGIGLFEKSLLEKMKKDLPTEKAVEGEKTAENGITE